jgi:YD repeat-containing protein
MIRALKKTKIALALCLSFGGYGVTAQTAPATALEYDANGNLTKTTSALPQVTKFEYDALSRPRKMTDAANAVTNTGYDANGQTTSVIDARTIATNYTIDGLGNLTQTSSQDTGLTQYAYDEAGNLTSRTDAKLQTTTYKYDALSRPLLITYADNTTVAFEYDQGANAVGQLSKITDVSGTTEFAYDAFGQRITETRTIGNAPYVTRYRYDDAGRLAGIVYPSGRSVDYEFDGAGQIKKISTTSAGTTTVLVSAINYQPFGPVASFAFGNGQTHVRRYDLNGRLSSFTLGSKTMAVSYDAASRITGIADAANTASGNTYGYDPVDRLKSVITPTASQGYVYDAVGNRTQKTNNGSATDYTYSPTSNRLTHVAGQPITMDANGSTTAKPGATFSYDVRGRMVSATTNIGLVTYTINSMGQRVRKVTPTENTVFHYDAGGKLIAESTTAAGVTKTQEYVYLGDMPVAVLK